MRRRREARAALAACRWRALAGARRRAAGATAAPPAPVDLASPAARTSWHADNTSRSTGPTRRPTARRSRPSTTGSATPPDRRDRSRPDTRLGGNGDRQRLDVPAGPGAYTAEVWLEDADGAGPAGQRQRCASTTPGPARSQPLASRRLDRPAPRCPTRSASSHPAGPQPVSGIRGYAVSVDRGAGSAPCAGPTAAPTPRPTCAAASATTRSRSATLPEGVTYVHARRRLRLGDAVGRGRRSDRAARRHDRPGDEPRRSCPAAGRTGPVALTATATDALLGDGARPARRARSPRSAVDGGAPRSRPATRPARP